MYNNKLYVIFYLFFVVGWSVKFVKVVVFKILWFVENFWVKLFIKFLYKFVLYDKFDSLFFSWIFLNFFVLRIFFNFVEML